MNKKVSVVLKLPQLQNLIKRDPKAYYEEFLMQQRHFDSELEIFKMKPTKDSDRFTELVNFVCHVSACYKEETAHVPGALMALLEEHSTNLHPDVRAKLIQSLILLRNKQILDPLPLLKLSFKLFAIQDKTLRVMLCEYIVNDIKGINLNKHNNQLNRSIQALLFTVVSSDADSTAARKTVQILAELYRRRIWTDARTVNVLASACLSLHVPVLLSAINFFLGIETKMHEDEDEEKAKVNTSEVNYHEHSKKTRKRQRQVQRAIAQNDKMRRKENVKSETIVPLFPAIQLIHDPQVLAEKLFKRLRQSNELFEVKLTLMNFISRLVGCHKLIHLTFYSFLQKYLTAHQKDVTKILAYLIQACHDLVPPEELLPVVKAIAHHFITERCSTEVISIGINSVREIFVRVPALLKEPGMDDFIQDLVLYGKKSHKSVMIAAHSVLNLVRELYPALLRQKDRGKSHNMNAVPADYGALNVRTGIEGAELLEAYERGDIVLDGDGEVIWKEDVDQFEDGSKKGSKKRKSRDNDNEEGDDDDDDEWEEVEEDDEGDNDSNGSDEEGGEWEDVDSDGESVEGGDEEDEEEEEEEGEWEDVEDGDSDDNDDDAEEESGSDDGDGEDDEMEQQQSEQTPAETSSSSAPAPAMTKRRIEARRLLTSADFELLAKLKAAQAERAKDPRQRKRTRDMDTSNVLEGLDTEEGGDDEEGGASSLILPDFTVSPDALAPARRTHKSTKIERITKILEGRKESKFDLGGHGGGLTNKEKERKKNFVMVRKGKRSVASKINKSNSDKRWDKMHQKEQYGREKRKRRRT